MVFTVSGRGARAVTALAIGATLLSTTGTAGASGRAKINPLRVPYSIPLADELLANLRFLPVQFVDASRPTPTTTTTPSSAGTTTPGAPSSATATTVASHSRASVTASPVALLRGHYAWRFADLPSPFKANWSVGTLNVIFRGALMRFQAQHNLPINGNMDGPTWHALVSAALRHQVSDETYNVVVVQRALPQRVWLYRNGKLSFTSLANTGIAAAPTAPGTYTVYLRYAVTTMSGTLPNGQPYHDTGIPWTSYFNGGDALHGFIRSTYGWPQSLGCVEMPFPTAKILWPYTPLGTEVTVE